jgi:hypothetical protein
VIERSSPTSAPVAWASWTAYRTRELAASNSEAPVRATVAASFNWSARPLTFALSANVRACNFSAASPCQSTDRLSCHTPVKASYHRSPVAVQWSAASVRCSVGQAISSDKPGKGPMASAIATPLSRPSYCGKLGPPNWPHWRRIDCAPRQLWRQWSARVRSVPRWQLRYRRAPYSPPRRWPDPIILNLKASHSPIRQPARANGRP